MLPAIFAAKCAKKVKLRRSPEFRFIADDSIEYSAGIYKMLDELNIGSTDFEEEE